MRKKLNMLIVLGVLLCALVFTAVRYHVVFADSGDYNQGWNQGYGDVERKCLYYHPSSVTGGSQDYSRGIKGQVSLSADASDSAGDDYNRGYHDGYIQASADYGGCNK